MSLGRMVSSRAENSIKETLIEGNNSLENDEK